MKKLLSASIAAATLATAGVSAPAMAGLSANVGMVSDYYFRGANLGDAGAYGGLDYDVAGFYIGVWAIDDGTDDAGGNDGLETDYYLGYGMDHDAVSWYVGYSRYDYTYTKDFEHELNLGVSGGGDWGSIALDIASGVDVDPEDGSGAPGDTEQPYTYVSLSYSKDIYSVTYATFIAGDSEDDGVKNDDTDYDYSYLEVGVSTEVEGIGLGATVGKVVDNNAAGEELDNSDYYIYFDISKSFDLL